MKETGLNNDNFSNPPVQSLNFGAKYPRIPKMTPLLHNLGIDRTLSETSAIAQPGRSNSINIV